MVADISSEALATILILVVDSSMAAATLFMLVLISSAATETALPFSDTLRMPCVISSEMADSSVEEEERVSTPPAMSLMRFCSLSIKVLNQAAKSPNSSLAPSFRRLVKSPSPLAISLSPETMALTGPVICRDMNQASPTPRRNSQQYDPNQYGQGCFVSGLGAFVGFFPPNPD